MSFNKVVSDDLETGSVISAQYKDFPEFEAISLSIDATLHEVNNTQLVAIRNLVRSYEALREAGKGQSEEAAAISRKFVEATGKCTSLFKSINANTQKLNAYLNECKTNHEDEDTLKYLRQKEALSLNLVRNSLRQFQSYQRKVKAFEKEYVDTATAGKSPAQEQTQSQMQVQITYEPINAEELEQQSLLVKEREREIQQISQDTHEINEIFLNLQDIIQEQQFQVNTIEDNILSYGADAQGASRELRRADRYQRRSGGKMLCCLFIIIGVFGSVILIGAIF